MKLLEKILTGALFALFALMIALVTIQVVNRYGTQFSIPWTEELTRTAYVLLIFMGSALAVLQCNHIRVLSVVSLLPKSTQRLLAVISGIGSAVFFGFVAYGNYIYTVINLDSVFPTMSWLTIGYVIATVFLTSVLSACLFLYRIVKPCPDDLDTDRMSQIQPESTS